MERQERRQFEKDDTYAEKEDIPGMVHGVDVAEKFRYSVAGGEI
jgi:hypothetical protein